MISRVAAIVAGLIAGLALFAALRLEWTATIAALGLERSHLVSLVVPWVPRLAWSIAAGVSAFAAVASLIALIGGGIEVLKARMRLGALRRDPALAGTWNAADWRAAFAPTAVADHAEAMIALLPIENGDERRVVVDTHLLTGLAPLWLDRLTLRRTLAPLPALAAGQGIALALIDYASAGRWDLDLAAGATGWLIVSVARYLAQTGLGPLVGSTVGNATAAMRPLASMQAFGAAAPTAVAATAGAAPNLDSATLALAFEQVLSGPLNRLTEAAEKLSAAGAGPSREQTIDAALAEIRAGIERLLDAAGHEN
jgi:hypothetical protein